MLHFKNLLSFHSHFTNSSIFLLPIVLRFCSITFKPHRFRSFACKLYVFFFLIRTKDCWQVWNENLIKISYIKSNTPTKIPLSLNRLLFLVWFDFYRRNKNSTWEPYNHWNTWQIVQIRCSVRVCVLIWFGILYVIGVNSNHFRINKDRIIQIQ